MDSRSTRPDVVTHEPGSRCDGVLQVNAVQMPSWWLSVCFSSRDRSTCEVTPQGSGKQGGMATEAQARTRVDRLGRRLMLNEEIRG